MVSRTSILLNPSMQVNIDADVVESELNQLLLEKASTFMMGGTTHRYNHMDKIFFLSRPVNQQDSTQKCPSCRYKFSDRKEMVFCTFCGYSNDDKCVQKTRLYPESARDHDTGRPS